MNFVAWTIQLLKWSSVKTFLLTEDERISRKLLTRRGARAESYSCETE